MLSFRWYLLNNSHLNLFKNHPPESAITWPTLKPSLMMLSQRPESCLFFFRHLNETRDVLLLFAFKKHLACVNGGHQLLQLMLPLLRDLMLFDSRWILVWCGLVWRCRESVFVVPAAVHTPQWGPSLLPGCGMLCQVSCIKNYVCYIYQELLSVR